MRVTSPAEPVGFDELRAVVGAGAGVVARFPGVVCVVRCPDPEPVRQLLSLCAQVAGPDPGRVLARRLATWISGPAAPGPELRFGTVAAAGDQIAVFLVGAVDARVEAVDGLVLSGADAAIGTDRLLPRPATPLRLSLDGAELGGDPADVHDLRAGVVPGAGIVLHPADLDQEPLVDHADSGALRAEHEWFDTGSSRPVPRTPFEVPERHVGGRNGAPVAVELSVEPSAELTPAEPDVPRWPLAAPIASPPGSAESAAADDPRAGRHSRAASGFGPVAGEPSAPPSDDAPLDPSPERTVPARPEPPVADPDEHATPSAADRGAGNGQQAVTSPTGPPAAIEDPRPGNAADADSILFGPLPSPSDPVVDAAPGVAAGPPDRRGPRSGVADLFAPAASPPTVSTPSGGFAAAAVPALVPAAEPAARGAAPGGAAGRGSPSPRRPSPLPVALAPSARERPEPTPRGAADLFTDAAEPAAPALLERRPRDRRGPARSVAAVAGPTATAVATVDVDVAAELEASDPGVRNLADPVRIDGADPPLAAPRAAADLTAAMPGVLVLAPAALPVPPAPTAPDGEPLPPRTARIRGYRCENGHLNDPRSPSCLHCGAPIDERVGGLVAGTRPPLGRLVFDDGAAHVVDGSYLVGRMPGSDERVQAGELRPIVVEDHGGSVSRVHAEVRVSGWDVIVVDTGSRNGTYVSGAGEGVWTALPPRRSRRLLPGTQVRIGARTFVFESTSSVR